jgi:diguanylate cyclase (GGDEF)-like protein
MSLVLQPRWSHEGWRRLQQLTAELVGQDDEVAILRVALADSPALFDGDRVEVWLAQAPHRQGLRAWAERGRDHVVEVHPVTGALPQPRAHDLLLPLVEGDTQVGMLRLVGCPKTGRLERERFAMGFAHLLSISLGAAHALGKERLRAQDSMRRAHQDGLTLLGNRWLLKEWGDHLIALASARSRTCAVLLFDVDGFKQINDTLGHDVGDQVLAELGRRVRRTVRENDLAVRLGGDEFVVLTDDLGSLRDAERLAERLLEAISKPLRLDDVELRIRSSVGIAVHGQDGEDTETLLRAADQAMYVSKAQGRGRWHRFTSPTQRPGDSFDRLLAEVDAGLLNDQLEVHYQPQVSAAGYRVTGFEALSRWRHPVLGLLTAKEFLPVVERAGRARQLTALVLDRALAELTILETAAPGASVAVNVSPRDLVGQALLPEVAGALARHDVPADRLTIEVTEPSPDSMESTALAGLAALGCTVSVSEYGTGPSSLSMLARHDAIREVKLDGVLVSQLPLEPARRLIAAVTVAAHALGVTVVAEGVESPAVAEQVRELGCDAVQGLHHLGPVPASEAAAWVREVFTPHA